MTVLKSMVVCLALANVIYFLWVHGVAQAPDPAGAAPVATLRLVSEAPAALRPAADPAASIAAADSATAASGAAANSGAAATSGAVGNSVGDAAPTDAKRCTSVGPFRDVAEAARAAGRLRADGYDPRQRVVDGEVWAGVWVYLAVPANPASTAPLLTRLKAAGIDDALEMPGPVDGSVISLGLFSEPKRAQARVAQAHALGLEPAIADRKRTGNVYWIDIDRKPTDGALNPADLQGEAGRISRLEAKPCPSVPPS